MIVLKKRQILSRLIPFFFTSFFPFSPFPFPFSPPQLIQNLNNISFWVVSEILEETELKMRVQAVEQAIYLLDAFKSLNNYHVRD